MNKFEALFSTGLKDDAIEVRVQALKSVSSFLTSFEETEKVD